MPSSNPNQDRSVESSDHSEHETVPEQAGISAVEIAMEMKNKSRSINAHGDALAKRVERHRDTEGFSVNPDPVITELRETASRLVAVAEQLESVKDDGTETP